MSDGKNIPNNHASQTAEGPFYKGIKLEGLDKETRMAHSAFFETSHGIEHFEALLERDKAELTPKQFDAISALSSVTNMNYQICNGGLEQYYFNEYDKERKPYNTNDVKHVSKEAQVGMLHELLGFGRDVFPERELENEKLNHIISDFAASSYKEEELDEEDYGYSDSEYFLDAPYDFDRRYYQVNDYLETLIEGYAQYLGKTIDLEMEREGQESPQGKEKPLSDLAKEAKAKAAKKNAARIAQSIEHKVPSNER